MKNESQNIELSENLIKVIGESLDDMYLCGWRASYAHFFGTEMDFEQERQLKEKIQPINLELVKLGIFERLKKSSETI